MESFAEVWENVCTFCTDNSYISDIGYSSWISTMKPIKLEGGKAYFSVRAVFQKNVIIDTYLQSLLIGFESILGFPVEIVIDVEDSGEYKNPFTAVPSKDLKQSLVQANYEHTFDTFIVGSSNKFAHAAAQAVASNPANAYNPLFIYGNSGLGKTHLLNAIYVEIKKNNPDGTVLSIKGEEFTNEFIKSLAAGNATEVQEKYRTADVLLVDDIQFISGKEQTQVAFFHIFEKLHENKKQIVLTSDRPPKEIKALDERIRSRFEMGLVADIAPPDFETRVAIMKRKADLLNIEIPDEVISYISDKLKTNIRQLEGMVKRLKAYLTLEGKKPTLQLAHIAIQDMITDTKSITTPDQIICEVARTFGVTPEEIRSKKRNAGISIARQVAIYVLREITQMPLKSIGNEFSRDHATVIYAIQQVEDTMKNDSYFKATVQDIITNLQDD